MKKSLKKTLSVLLSLTMIAGTVVLPAATASADTEYTPLVAGDTVLNEWKFDFVAEGATPKDGYTAVTPDRNIIVDGEYGFIGNDGNGFRVSEKYDSFRYQQGQTMNLEAKESGSGIGIVPDDKATYPQYTTGDYYPVSFALSVNNGSYYRVHAEITTLDDTKDAVASLYYERRHPVMHKQTIPKGTTVPVDFSVDVETINFKSDGNFVDDMLNIALLGDNAALATLQIQKIDTTAEHKPTTLWVIGDSTVTDQSASIPYFDLQNYEGVGGYISKYLPSTIAVSNQGEGGLNATDNAHFNIAKANIKTGDYMYVQYGHNHKNPSGAVTTKNRDKYHSGEYWLNNYLSSLPKYYNACKATEKDGGVANLIIVGNIDRHLDKQYNSEKNTWSSTLEAFSTLGKRYVDCLMYGGEEGAETFLKKWAEISAKGESVYNKKLDASLSDGTAPDTTAEEAEIESLKSEADTIYNNIIAGEKNGVTNVGYVDLNKPTLDWLATVSEKGTVNGEEVKNSKALTDFYFQTPRGGSADDTHPNDAGADALAYRFFSTADTASYPILTPLMASYSTKQPVPVSAAIMNAGWAGKSAYWPMYASPVHYDYAALIQKANFDEKGVLKSVAVKVQDNTMMNTYSQLWFGVYDAETGVLKKAAVSSDHIDNTNNPGVYTLEFDTDLTVGEGETYRIYLWGYKDDPEHGSPTTMVPYAKAFVPTEVEAYLIPGQDSDIETFDYYGAEKLDDDSTPYTFGGSGGHTLTLGKDESEGFTYAKVAGDGDKTENGVKKSGEGSFYIMRPFDNLESGAGTSGKLYIKADVQYISGGGLNFAFAKSTTPNKSPFISDEVVAFTIGTDGKVTAGGEEAGTLVANKWATIEYTLDMDAGTADISVGGQSPVKVNVDNYKTFAAPKIDNLKHFIMEGQKVAFDVNVTNLTVAKLARNKEQSAVNVSVNDASRGAVTIDEEAVSSKTVKQGDTVTVKAEPANGYVLSGWTTDGGAAFEGGLELSLRMYKDLNLTAVFEKQSGIDGIENYTLASEKQDVKITSGQETTVNLKLEDVVDENNNPVVAALSDVTNWTCDDPSVTVENGVVTIPASYDLAENSKKEITVTSTLNGKDKSCTLVLYTYAFYENVNNGKTTAQWDGVTGALSSKNCIGMPGSTEGEQTFVLTLPEPVAIKGKKIEISYIAAMAAGCEQPRYFEFYDGSQTPAKVINEIMGYSWGTFTVGGTAGGKSISGGTDFASAISGTWSDPVTITLNGDGTGKVKIGSGSTEAAITYNADAETIGSIRLIAKKNAPNFNSRALGVTDITIKEIAQ